MLQGIHMNIVIMLYGLRCLKLWQPNILKTFFVSLTTEMPRYFPQTLKIRCKHYAINWSSCGLVEKGVGLFMKFRVQIPKRSVVVLGMTSNLKMRLSYIRKPCSVASIVCRVPKRKKKRIGFSPGNNAK